MIRFIDNVQFFDLDQETNLFQRGKVFGFSLIFQRLLEPEEFSLEIKSRYGPRCQTEGVQANIRILS